MKKESDEVFTDEMMLRRSLISHLHLMGHGMATQNCHSKKNEPQHTDYLLFDILHAQEILQIVSCNYHYMRLHRKSKMTMQGFWKNCFFFVFAKFTVVPQKTKAKLQVENGSLQYG